MKISVGPLKVAQKFKNSLKNSSGWAPSVLMETCNGVPCAFTSNADVSTMLFKLKGWPGRHSSLSQSVAVIELET